MQRALVPLLDQSLLALPRFGLAPRLGPSQAPPWVWHLADWVQFRAPLVAPWSAAQQLRLRLHCSPQKVVPNWVGTSTRRC